jgi:hypothetical protein
MTSAAGGLEKGNSYAIKLNSIQAKMGELLVR